MKYELTYLDRALDKKTVAVYRRTGLAAAVSHIINHYPKVEIKIVEVEGETK